MRGTWNLVLGTWHLLVTTQYLVLGTYLLGSATLKCQDGRVSGMVLGNSAAEIIPDRVPVLFLTHCIPDTWASGPMGLGPGPGSGPWAQAQGAGSLGLGPDPLPISNLRLIFE